MDEPPSKITQATTMTTKFFSLLVAFLCVEHALGFATPKQPVQKVASLASSSNDNNNQCLVKNTKTTAASVMAAAFLFSNVLVAVEPAVAFSVDDFSGSTTEILAGRSGGRMGGRSSMGSRAAPSRTYSRSTTTVVRPMVSSPVIVAPSPFGFGLNPFGGFGKKNAGLCRTLPFVGCTVCSGLFLLLLTIKYFSYV